VYVRKRVICEWCRWHYKNPSSWTNFTASRSWTKSFFTIVCRYRERSHRSHTECVMCMQRNGYSFTVFFRWTRFLLIWLVKTATDFESLVPRRKHVEKAWISTGPVIQRSKVETGHQILPHGWEYQIVVSLGPQEAPHTPFRIFNKRIQWHRQKDEIGHPVYIKHLGHPGYTRPPVGLGSLREVKRAESPMLL
jgi:hypothetical protein